MMQNQQMPTFADFNKQKRNLSHYQHIMHEPFEALQRAHALALDVASRDVGSGPR